MGGARRLRGLEPEVGLLGVSLGFLARGRGARERRGPEAQVLEDPAHHDGIEDGGDATRKMPPHLTHPATA
jgi:hypothetical protein